MAIRYATTSFAPDEEADALVRGVGGRHPAGFDGLEGRVHQIGVEVLRDGGERPSVGGFARATGVETAARDSIVQQQQGIGSGSALALPRVGRAGGDVVLFAPAPASSLPATLAAAWSC